MASSPITSRQIDGETVTDFIFLGSKITADGDFSHEIKRRDKQAVCESSSNTSLRCEQAAKTFTTGRCPDAGRGTPAEDTCGLNRRLFKTTEIKQPELLRSCCRKQKCYF